MMMERPQESVVSDEDVGFEYSQPEPVQQVEVAKPAPTVHVDNTDKSEVHVPLLKDFEMPEIEDMQEGLEVPRVDTSGDVKYPSLNKMPAYVPVGSQNEVKKLLSKLP